MRYIYSIIGAIILLISGTQSAFAQKETTITRTILGCTLGVSTVDSVTAMLQKMDADFEAVESTPPRENILLQIPNQHSSLNSSIRSLLWSESSSTIGMNQTE